MTIEYRKAGAEEAEMLINIYNASFYSDYKRFGVCPGYGKTIEMMEESIKENPKYIILCDNKPVGCISCKMLEMRVYEITCLCIVPEYQCKGLGTQAVQFVKALYDDWEKFTLVTPVDKKENVKFYTEKCGFRIASIEKDGNVELARFIAER
jgi:ribosomal protein S18 acetylase RimI-like enzyme